MQQWTCDTGGPPRSTRPSLILLTSTLDHGVLGPFFYRFNRAGELSAS
jgi:hypothetical protein